MALNVKPQKYGCNLNIVEFTFFDTEIDKVIILKVGIVGFGNFSEQFAYLRVFFFANFSKLK